jgi:hypothetical protein
VRRGKGELLLAMGLLEGFGMAMLLFLLRLLGG